jgi:competence protein ComEC
LFWKEQPALLVALCLLIGSGSVLFWDGHWLWIWPILWTLYLCFVRSYPSILLIFASALYAYFLYPPIQTDRDLYYFSINTLKKHETPFHKSFIYNGWLNHKIPCSIQFRGESRPLANCDYLVRGELQQRGSYSYVLKATQWKAVEKTWSWAEWRYTLKSRFRTFLEKKLPRSGVFLTSLVTGELDDRMLRFEFSRLGLSHILAVSGFHFGVLIGFCSFFLKFFVPKRTRWVLLMGLTTAYFFFVGAMPAVQRAWIGVQIYLIGQWLGRHSSGLNLMGTAMLIEILLDPLVCGNLGFQLSFTCCAGILLLYPLIHLQIQRFLPRRSPLELFQLSRLSKHFYLFSILLRKGISLGLAVNIATIPLLLYHFQQFPLLGLLYNLFFPLLVGIAMSLLLISFAVPFLFPVTDFFTAQILDVSSYPPLSLDCVIGTQHLPAWAIPLYFFTLFCFTIWHRNLTAKMVFSSPK